ncbi:hypothetical protein ACP4OV_018540 [Aristida adscensionis]
MAGATAQAPSTIHRGVYDGRQYVSVKFLDLGEDGHRSEHEIAALGFTELVRS